MSDSERISLEMNLQNQDKAMTIEDLNLFLDLDNEFHHFFYQLTNHEEVWSWIKTINVQFDRYRFLSLIVNQLSLNELITDHENILKAVLKNDVKQVAQFTKRHLERALEEEKSVIAEFPDYFTNTNIQL